MEVSMKIAAFLLVCALLAFPVYAADHPSHEEAAASSPDKSKNSAFEEEKPPLAEEKPVVTRHQITINGKTLSYTATAGTLPIKDAAGKTEARIFFVSYTADTAGKPSQRPLLFAFNGGPGSSSVWLHLGAVGPKRVSLPENGSMPAPPYKLIDNPETWLSQADLVFIDPVGCGFSRADKTDQASKFFSLKGDIESVGEFIRLYLTRYERWSSPLFLAGESYGTTRAAGLANDLIENGIACNGIILISTVLNFDTISFTPGNDLPYALFLPSYTATSWYHHRLPADFGRDLQADLREVEQWALSVYLPALAKGDQLAPAERREIIRRLARYTGLDEMYIDNCNLRIEAQRFSMELLRQEKRMVGRFDSRLSGADLFAVAETPAFDPSLAAVRPPFTAAFNYYVRSELGYKTDQEYYILGGGIGHWEWGADNSFAETTEALRKAFSKNPHMKLFVASGLFDLATPYLSTEYTLGHLELADALRQNITTIRYDSGHMLYTDAHSRIQLEHDVAAFIHTALAPP
jgi:carboxypeptidase C (cathepsin A)